MCVLFFELIISCLGNIVTWICLTLVEGRERLAQLKARHTPTPWRRSERAPAAVDIRRWAEILQKTLNFRNLFQVCANTNYINGRHTFGFWIFENFENLPFLILRFSEPTRRESVEPRGHQAAQSPIHLVYENYVFFGTWYKYFSN